MLESLGFKKPGLKIEKNFSIEKKKSKAKKKGLQCKMLKVVYCFPSFFSLFTAEGGEDEKDWEEES